MQTGPGIRNRVSFKLTSSYRYIVERRMPSPTHMSKDGFMRAAPYTDTLFI